MWPPDLREAGMGFDELVGSFIGHVNDLDPWTDEMQL